MTETVTYTSINDQLQQFADIILPGKLKDLLYLYGACIMKAVYLILSDTLLTESIYDTYCIAQLDQAYD